MPKLYILPLPLLLPLLLTITTASPFPAPADLRPTTALFNATAVPATITCLPHTRSSARIDPTACGILIREFRTYSDFGRDQSWREGVSPVLYPDKPNSVPPFIWFSPRDREGKCGILVDAAVEDAVDVFSWRRVVILVGAILARCSMEGSGGYANLGERGSWQVKVSSYGEPNIAVLEGNGTAVV